MDSMSNSSSTIGCTEQQDHKHSIIQVYFITVEEQVSAKLWSALETSRGFVYQFLPELIAKQEKTERLTGIIQ
jgi:hypothetical protein